MNITGSLLIGHQSLRGSDGSVKAINPHTGEELEPSFGGATLEDMRKACALAADAFDAYREVPLEQRAGFLERIASNIMALRDPLIDRCMAESGLSRARLEGERDRTVAQLRLFAEVVRDGGFLDIRIDPALPERKPMPRVDLRLRHIPMGPVAVFSASNFPFAFSVAGGDAASAFAAGCPVIVKAHPAHPGTSEMVGRAVQQAVLDCGLPEGVFSLIHTSGIEVAQALVADPRVAAVGFTGSRRGGVALMNVAASRPEPIPVYAEMSSINPVVLLPGALSHRAAAIGRDFISSLTLGAGQFCTNPGLVLAVQGEGLDTFLSSAAEAIQSVEAATMLTPGIHQAYDSAVAALSAHPRVDLMGQGLQGNMYQGQATLFVTTAQAFLEDDVLQAEIFGAASLVLRCRDEAELHLVLERMEGQLTAAMQMADEDTEAARRLLPLLEKRVGRILVNAFGTGVEVSHAMVHGGPYPATSDGRTTSVGTLAIRRFLRPVSYQDVPEALLPEALKDHNPLKLWRRLDGRLTQP